MERWNISNVVSPHLSDLLDDEDQELEEILREQKEWMALCHITAIDGTHVKARLPQGQEIPCIGRKGYPSQNILAFVDFNMCFTFAWAGWEGVTHDSRIFAEALRREELNFPHPSGNKYYLVDAGYSHMKGYNAPYKENNVRYHLAEFRRGATRQLRETRGCIEKFNYLHSSCRNVVERTFGI
ncbi:uncharacterized protein LOC129894786 [Solanum dulcamara]|uniref:uncharacterized protein LOC129894786 n=1 Tax=Solanum dulcamara TaxID=45834 RepID=UPI002486BEFF|nr:uncharacterized protein LOC129894786 [Solanum dulcamara]